MSESRVIVALDYPSEKSAMAFVEQVDSQSCKLKIGKELFTRAGPQFVEKVVAKGFDVFLDLKFHDIPNTVSRACQAAADLGVWMLNVHALGGKAMLEAAVEGVGASTQQPLLIAVTVLTSMDSVALKQVGIGDEPAEVVQRLASLSQQAGLNGVVCSAQEASILREKLGSPFLLVTPGIRPASTEVGDQKRVMTPQAALEAGSDYLVIGRPVTQAADPLAVLEQINQVS